MNILSPPSDAAPVQEETASASPVVLSEHGLVLGSLYGQFQKQEGTHERRIV